MNVEGHSLRIATFPAGLQSLYLFIIKLNPVFLCVTEILVKKNQFFIKISIFDKDSIF